MIWKYRYRRNRLPPLRRLVSPTETLELSWLPPLPRLLACRSPRMIVPTDWISPATVLSRGTFPGFCIKFGIVTKQGDAMTRKWIGAGLVACGLFLLTGCGWRDRAMMMRYREQCPTPTCYDRPCCVPVVSCGCDQSMPVCNGMPAPVDPCPPGPMGPGPIGPGPVPFTPGAIPGTGMPPLAQPPANIPPDQARPLPATPSKNTRVVQPASKSDF